MCSLPVLSPSMIVVSVASRAKDADFWGNVVSCRWLALSMRLLTSIRAVYTLLVSPLHVISVWDRKHF